MAISCQLKTLFDKPIEGVFVELKCKEHPEQHFSGISDKSGVIDEWMSIREQNVQHVQCTPNMEGSHLQMRFQAPLVFGETFPDTWNTVWVPQKENSHLVIHVAGDMYAVIKDRAKNRVSLPEPPRTSPPDMTFSFGASENKNNPTGFSPPMFSCCPAVANSNPPGQQQPVFCFDPSGLMNNSSGPFNFGTVVPHDRAQGFEERGTRADATCEIPCKTQRIVLQPKKLRRSARLAKF